MYIEVGLILAHEGKKVTTGRRGRGAAFFGNHPFESAHTETAPLRETNATSSGVLKPRILGLRCRFRCRFKCLQRIPKLSAAFQMAAGGCRNGGARKPVRAETEGGTQIRDLRRHLGDIHRGYAGNIQGTYHIGE